MRVRFVTVVWFLALALPGCSSSTPWTPPPPEPAISVEDIKVSATTPKYDDLARTPEEFVGKPLTFTGEVVQVAGDDSRRVLRVNVTDGPLFYEDTIWVNVKAEGVRVLKDDIVQLWAIGKGEKTYKAVMGNEVTIPQVDAYALEIVTKAGDR